MSRKIAKKEIDDLGEALQILDSAAQKSSQEVQSMIEADYRHLKETVEKITPEVKTALSTVGKRISDKASATAENASAFAKETAQDVDQHAKENPWLYVGGAAVAGGALGYFLTRKD